MEGRPVATLALAVVFLAGAQPEAPPPFAVAIGTPMPGRAKVMTSVAGPPQLVSVRRAWVVMGTALEIAVYRPAGSEAAALADLRAAYAAIRDVDRRMSLYRADSELNRLNARAGQGGVQVSAPLLAVLQAARYYGLLSAGALDVTVEPLVRLWGFGPTAAAGVPSAESIQQARAHVGLDRMRLDAVARTVELAAGTRIDLGAIAKGWAVDRALDALSSRGVQVAIVDLGGNVGVLGVPPGDSAWPVAVRHPRVRQATLGILRLRGRAAVATSGDYERFFEASGRRYAHVLDPRTGYPVDAVVAASVIAPSATAADALSTAVMVLGPEPGGRLLAGCRDLTGLIVVPERMGPPEEPDRAAVPAGELLALWVPGDLLQRGSLPTASVAVAASFTPDPGAGLEVRSIGPSDTQRRCAR